MKEIFLNDDINQINRVYAEIKHKEDKVFSKKQLLESGMTDVEVIYSTWGMPVLTSEEIEKCLPNLKEIYYAAGTVKFFAKPYLERGVRVFSAWKANAVPVAEYAVAQILLANKGFYQMQKRTRENYNDARAFSLKFCGNYNAKIGILGYGSISSLVVDALKNSKVEILLYSSHMTEERAKALGVKLAGLDEIFSTCDVISNHMANNEKNVGILNKKLFSKMKDYSTFINTGRGAQVDENALIEVMKDNPTLTAVLDVTFPEPPTKDSPLYSLDNIIVTPHIAGSSGNEVCRMAQYMLEEKARVDKGETPLYEVDEKTLESMA